jgi:integrase
MAKRGISVKTLQYLMGHADIQTTLNTYTHIKLDDAKNELERLQASEAIKNEMAVTGMQDAKRELKRVKGI